MKKIKNILSIKALACIIVCAVTWEYDFITAELHNNRVDKALIPVEEALEQGKIDVNTYQELCIIIENAVRHNTMNSDEINQLITGL